MATLVGSVGVREPALLFIAKTFRCWELTFTTDSNSSESLIDSSDNEWDSDLTDTSELLKPLAE
jgi:hypothetical protein